VTRTTVRTPVLERAGAAPTTTQQSEERRQYKKLKAEALRAGTTEALADFLDSTGMIDNLL
jgi:glutaminase